MKIKTKDLTGAALDYAVALALGLKIRSQKRGESGRRPGFYAVGDAYNYIWRDHARRCPGNRHWWCPSQCWRDGGPLTKYIETLDRLGDEWQCTYAPNQLQRYGVYSETGPAPLIAICRAVVAYKLGDEVEVPDELREVE